MNRLYLQILQVVVQAALVGLLFRAKKRSDGLPEAARKDRNYALNAAIIAAGLGALISTGFLVSAITDLKVTSPTP